ncbi:MAG: hypothetical protein ACYC6L_04245 [Anaerolineae bacterium]
MLAATGTLVLPTTTNTATPTSLPTLTNTLRPTSTFTAIPTRTPLPTLAPQATSTLLPTMAPRPTYGATQSAPPATITPRPILTAVPPTATAMPLAVLEKFEVDNGTFGKRDLIVRYEGDPIDGESFYVTGTDGHRYKATMGFLPNASAAATIQQYWDMAGRGSANWGMVILVRKQIADWYLCTTADNVCYTSQVDAGQAVLFVDIYLRDSVWKSLLIDYLYGGILRTTTNAYYSKIQEAVFLPMADKVPTTPCIGFGFVRVD